MPRPAAKMGPARELLQAVGNAAATQYPKLTALMSGG